MSANGLHRIRWRRVAVERVHWTVTCQFARDLVCIQQSIDGGGWKMLANGLHRIRWRRVAVERVHRTAACQFARDLVYIQQSIVVRGVENVGKRTPSDPMETGCRGTSPSDCRMSFRESLSIYTPYIQQTIVVRGVENVGKRTPSDPMETGCRGNYCN